MSVPAADVLAWVGRRAGECIPAVGVLGVRPLRYLADRRDPVTPTIPALLVRVRGLEERPLWHQDTGIYGFLNLPPGSVTLEVSDLARRYVPMVVTTTVPDRTAVRDSLAAGLRPRAGSAGPHLLDVPMRSAPEMALPPGSTAVWGVVRQIADGSSVPGTLLRLHSVLSGRAVTVTTQAGPDGSYLLVLPGEAPDRTVSPPRRDFLRALEVFAPGPALAAALNNGFLSGMPPDLLTNDPATSGSPLQARGFRLRDASGTLLTGAGGTNPEVLVAVRYRVRWDVELGA